jgi:threonine synthase
MTQSIDRTIQSTTTEQTFTHLTCRECGETYELGAKHVCEDVCFGPLEVTYDYDVIRRRVSRETIQAGPLSIWRYKDFLPVTSAQPIDVGTGMTPLLQGESVGQKVRA